MKLIDLKVGILLQSTAFPITGRPAANFIFVTKSGVPTKTEVPVSTIPLVTGKGIPPTTADFTLTTHQAYNLTL